MFFVQPRLSSVAALVGKQREREEKQRKLEEMEAERQAEEKAERQADRDKKELLADLETLASETAQLAQRLSFTERGRDGVKGKLSTRGNLETGPSTPAQQRRSVRRNAAGGLNHQAAAVHEDFLEDIATAIFQGQSAICVHLRKFLENYNATSEPVHVEGVEANQTGLTEVIEFASSPRTARRAIAMMPESTKSRAHKTDLLCKLTIRKKLCGPFHDKDRFGQHQTARVSSSENGKRDSESLNNVWWARKTLSEYFEAFRARTRYISLESRLGRNAVCQAQENVNTQLQKIQAVEDEDSSSLSSFSESDFPFEVWNKTRCLDRPREPNTCSRMFENDSEEDAKDVGDCFVGFAQGDQEQESIAGLDISIDVCSTPREENAAALIDWVQHQRRMARDFNYLRIGAATRMQAKWRGFLVHKKIKSMKASIQHLQAYARGALAHRVIATRIVSWLEPDNFSSTPFSHLKHTAYTTQPFSTVQNRIRNAQVLASPENATRRRQTKPSDMHYTSSWSCSTTAGDSMDDGESGQ